MIAPPTWTAEEPFDRVHDATSSASAASRAAVRSIQRRSASRWKRPWSARRASTRLPSLLELGELAHPPEVRGPLHVEVLLRRAAEHEREHDLHEEVGLEVGLGRDRLGEPRLDLALPGLGDGVALAVRTGSGLSLAGDRLSVPRQAGEGGVHLAERKRPAPAEVGVVVALQVVAVARFAVEEPEEGHGNAHT